ncbi:MAG: class I SAM-dependent methyltransferase, partial [Flavobacteriaceae bacterium]
MVKPYQNSSSSKKEQVTTMFDGIADNYDSLNRVISMGIDKSWRRKLVAMAANKKPKTIVDVATGTGDLAIALTSIPSATITGIDIAVEMLEIGKQKINQRKLDRKINMI